MSKAAVVALIVATLLIGLAVPALGQGRPRRVDPSRTVPPPNTDEPAATAPQQAPQGTTNDAVTLEGALIEVPVVVADRSGHYVPKLTAQDFLVLEDGVEQQISFFSSERVPIHVAIVMDTSGSTRDTIFDIQDAAIEFVNQLMPGDKVMIVSFASQVIVEQEFTNDRGQLASAIRRTQAHGSTKLYEAVYLSVAERLRHVEGRKAMIILSDGEDTASKDVTFAEAVNVCSESDVVVYGIRYPESDGTNVYRNPGQFPNTGPFPPSYPQPRNRRRNRPRINIPNLPWPFAPSLSPMVSAVAEPQFGGRSPGQRFPRGGQGNDQFMETITSNSGGTLFYAESVTNVSGLFSIIAEELRHVYIVGYSPTNSLTNGGYRRISVRMPRRPDLAVRHRLGYQAEAYK